MNRKSRLARRRTRHAVAAAPWLCAVLTAACSYYTDELLTGAIAVSGGAGASSDEPSTGGGALGGGGTASSGTAGAIGGSEVGGTGGIAGGTSPDSAGADNAGGAAPDMNSAGAGGQPPDDACPNDPNKLEPGQCGCGVAESCVGLKAALAHRYSFNQAGTNAPDSIGTAHGKIVGVSAANGKVTFDGTAAAYVDLPNGIISSLKDATFETWLQWGGGNVWQRVFDFGSNDVGENSQGTGTTYLYLTPSDAWTGNALRSAFSVNGVGSETVARAAQPLPASSVQHLVLVFDDTKNELRLFLNGNVAALTGCTQSLSNLNDVNNWLGRSNFKDSPLKGSIDEFRIYKAALTAAQVQASYDFGPNPSFL